MTYHTTSSPMFQWGLLKKLHIPIKFQLPLLICYRSIIKAIAVNVTVIIHNHGLLPSVNQLLPKHIIYIKSSRNSRCCTSARNNQLNIICFQHLENRLPNIDILCSTKWIIQKNHLQQRGTVSIPRINTGNIINHRN